MVHAAQQQLGETINVELDQFHDMIQDLPLSYQRTEPFSGIKSVKCAPLKLRSAEAKCNNLWEIVAG